MPALETFVEPPVRGKHKILIVEDEALVAADLEERLNSLGYEVCRAHVIGATLETESIRGQGVKITCTFENRA